MSGLGVNNPLWYVSVLLICHAVLYCLCRISSRTGFSLHYLFVIMVLAGSGAHYYNIRLPFLNAATGRGYVSFFLGMLLQELYSHKGQAKKFYALCTGVAAAVLACFAFDVMIDDQWAIFTFLLWPSLLFVFLGMERFFALKLFHFLGALSFEMYIWHSPLLLLYKSARKFLGVSSGCTRWEMILFTVCLIAACIPMTAVVERKINDWVRTRRAAL